MRRLFVSCLTALAFAAYTQAAFINIVESRVAGGAQNPLYTQSGPAVTSAKSTAAGLSGTGSYYAGDTTPAKWGEWSFTPAAGFGGYYNVYGTWANNTYASGIPAPTWTVNNAGAPITIAIAQTAGGNAWNALAAGVLLNAGTAYKTKLTTAATNVSGKRTYFDSVKWEAATPGAPTALTVAGGTTDVPLIGIGNELSWTAGSFSSFFDVFLSVDGGSSWGPAQRVTSASFDPDAYPLLPSTNYTWKVVAGNVDVNTASATAAFSTLPEPATMLLLALGGLLPLRRRS